MRYSEGMENRVRKRGGRGKCTEQNWDHWNKLIGQLSSTFEIKKAFQIHKK